MPKHKKHGHHKSSHGSMHHHSKHHDHMHESRGGYDLSRPEGYNAEFIGGAGEPYGMPQNIIIKEWPKCDYDNNQYYDYGIKSQDEQIGGDISKMKKHRSKDRY